MPRVCPLAAVTSRCAARILAAGRGGSHRVTTERTPTRSAITGPATGQAKPPLHVRGVSSGRVRRDASPEPCRTGTSRNAHQASQRVSAPRSRRWPDLRPAGRRPPQTPAARPHRSPATARAAGRTASRSRRDCIQNRSCLRGLPPRRRLPWSSRARTVGEPRGPGTTRRPVSEPAPKGCRSAAEEAACCPCTTWPTRRTSSGSPMQKSFAQAACKLPAAAPPAAPAAHPARQYARRSGCAHESPGPGAASRPCTPASRRPVGLGSWRPPTPCEGRQDPCQMAAESDHAPSAATATHSPANHSERRIRAAA